MRPKFPTHPRHAARARPDSNRLLARASAASAASTLRETPGEIMERPSVFVWLGCILLHLFIAPCHAANTVLILNSDMTVERYQQAQEAFKETLNLATLDLDLSRQPAERQIERQIRQARPEFIYCIGTRAYNLVHNLDRDKNIVISSAINVKRLPVGSRTYGIANEMPAAIQLTYFRFFFPEVKRIGVLYSSQYNQEIFEEAVAAGRDVDIQVVGARIRRTRNLERSLKELLPKVDALWLVSDPLVLATQTSTEEILRQADAAQKPIFTFNPAFVDAGATLAISPDTPTIGRQAATLINELIGSKKLESRFQEPAGSEIILNLRKVNQYGLKLNDDALSSVNRIVR
jgi:putative tryptophan/tyrosine transport system substrate-binding protein